MINPRLSAAELQKLAVERPDLWDQILLHPKCYPGLAQWIKRHQKPAPKPPVFKPKRHTGWKKAGKITAALAALALVAAGGYWGVSTFWKAPNYQPSRFASATYLTKVELPQATTIFEISPTQKGVLVMTEDGPYQWDGGAITPASVSENPQGPSGCVETKNQSVPGKLMPKTDAQPPADSTYDVTHSWPWWVNDKGEVLRVAARADLKQWGIYKDSAPFTQLSEVIGQPGGMNSKTLCLVSPGYTGYCSENTLAGQPRQIPMPFDNGDGFGTKAGIFPTDQGVATYFQDANGKTLFLTDLQGQEKKEFPLEEGVFWNVNQYAGYDADWENHRVPLNSDGLNRPLLETLINQKVGAIVARGGKVFAQEGDGKTTWSSGSVTYSQMSWPLMQDAEAVVGTWGEAASATNPHPLASGLIVFNPDGKELRRYTFPGPSKVWAHQGRIFVAEVLEDGKTGSWYEYGTASGQTAQ